MQTDLLNVGAGRVRRAFSLVEMMVVLLILAVVLAIVVPALSAARNTARKAATNAVMNQLATSCAAFQMDERRLPGYYTVRDVGSAGNDTRGFSAMNNILADLAGGIVQNSSTSTTVQVGPVAGTTQIYIDTALIGSSRQISGVTNKSYFQPDPKFFGIVTGKEGDAQHNLLPDLLDSWGTPILAWQQDETPNTTGDFSALNSGTPAKFYWVQNAAYLKSTGLGKFTINQSTDSWLGSGAGNRVDSLRAVLGTPAFVDPEYPNPPTMRPAQARAPIVFQSAGYNSTYCGRTERGGKIAAGNSGTIAYSSPADAMEAFDDFLAKVSN